MTRMVALGVQLLVHDGGLTPRSAASIRINRVPNTLVDSRIACPSLQTFLDKPFIHFLNNSAACDPFL